MNGIMNNLDLLIWQQLFLERIQKAEQAHRVRELPVQGAKPVSWLRTFLGNLLIGSGHRIKGIGPATWAGA